MSHACRSGNQDIEEVEGEEREGKGKMWFGSVFLFHERGLNWLLSLTVLGEKRHLQDSLVSFCSFFLSLSCLCFTKTVIFRDHGRDS